MDEKIYNFIDQNKDRFIAEFIDWCTIPSISADSSHQADMHAAADWAIRKLDSLGFSTHLFSTPKHPIVFAELSNGDPASQTVLIYGHYDVQPVDPLNKWHSDPFKPEIRDNYLIARGVSDMKGPTLSAILAVEALQGHYDHLPVNIKFLIEGEEEIGSPSISDFFASHKGMLKADVSINLDSGMADKNTPSITYALRGMASFELQFTGPDHDLHSGSFGGTVQNPAQAMAKLLAGLHDENGHVLLPGFYDKVRHIDESEHQLLSSSPVNDRYVTEVTGAPAAWGEKEFTTPERMGARPTVEINGLWSGYTGEGSKTIIPSTANVKISMRLVPDQDPMEIAKIFEAYVKEHTPPTMKSQLSVRGSGSIPFIMEPDNPLMKRYSEAIEQIWHKKPLLRREGGGIPIVIKFRDMLGIPSILAGYSSPDSNAHGPNENLNLDTWFKGIKTVAHYIDSFNG